MYRNKETKELVDIKDWGTHVTFATQDGKAHEAMPSHEFNTKFEPAEETEFPKARAKEPDILKEPSPEKKG